MALENGNGKGTNNSYLSQDISDVSDKTSLQKDKILAGDFKKPLSMMDVQLYTVKPSSTI